MTIPIWNALQIDLNHVQNSEEAAIPRINRSLQQVQKALNELKRLILQSGFNDQAEEIEFFKHDLPKFYALYLHFTHIHQIENRMPPGKENQLKYLGKEIKHLSYYFDQHPDWVLYYRSGASHLDENYFLRQPKGIPMLFFAR